MKLSVKSLAAHQKFEDHETILFSSFHDIDPIDILSEYPKVIEIHPTDVCNQACQYCFHGGKGFGKNSVTIRKQNPISDWGPHLFTQMKKVGIQNLSISGGGEPLMYSGIDDLIFSAKENGLNVRLVTHGNFADPNIHTSLKICDNIRISLDTMNANTYLEMRGVKQESGLMDETIKNISKLVKIRNNQDSYPHVGVSCVVTNKNINEMSTFIPFILEELNADTLILKSDIYSQNKNEVLQLINIIDKFKLTFGDQLLFRSDVPNGLTLATKCFSSIWKVAFDPLGKLYSCCLGAQPGDPNGYELGQFKLGEDFDLFWRHTKAKREDISKGPISCSSCNYTDKLLNYQIIELIEKEKNEQLNKQYTNS